ncbi:MAG: Gfo/Idh/MocA family oxidoreductase [Myxococcales bacterium]|nr:MAG: Gfo/Idh/MocA family oxidoreductase [Myxococcales bacterium]
MTERAHHDLSAQGRTIGWAVVGLGKFTTERLLPAFAHCHHSRLAALVSGSTEKLGRLGEQHGVPAEHRYDYSAFERLRDDRSVDAVYIVLPNALHAEYTIRAARAGKHVLCEKPMATSSADALAMINICRASQRLLMIAYRARFEPHNRAAIAAVRAGEVGALRGVVADHARPLDPADPADGWRTRHALAGGGSLVDIGIYGLNAARYLTGEEPLEVSGMVTSPAGDERFTEVEETASFLLRFPSGAVATGTSSYGAERIKRVHAYGSQGRLELDPATEYEGNRLRIGSGPDMAPRDVPPGDQFALQIDHLSRCILDGTAPLTPGEEGLRDMYLIEAIYQSARTGERVQLDPHTGAPLPPPTRSSMMPGKATSDHDDFKPVHARFPD